MMVGSATTHTGLDVNDVESAPLPQRWLGKTGEQVPALGMGTGPGGMGMEDEKAIALYERAIDLGVTYFDTAPGYQRAQTQLGRVMRRRRDEVFLVTKTQTARADDALKILERSLKDLQTERVDLTYVHSLGKLDVEQVLAGDGALAGLREAQKRGWTRYIGFTAHNMPWKAARVLQEADVDVAMVALNFVDRHTYNFEEVVLPLAVERGVGIAAMKVYGGARDMKYDRPRPSALETHGAHYHEKALRYALSLPGVAVAVIGMYREEELLQNVEWVRNHSPIAPAEEEALVSRGREIAAAWGPHFGAVR
jgi:aryl-alcohol dehydrogenase-like predicted oxidoreductase